MSKALTYVEIDYDFCGRTYGQAGCTAAIGRTGDRKCFNTRATCQVPGVYQRTVKTLRYVMRCGYEPSDIPAIPSLTGVQTTPARIRPGEDLGERASVTVSFRDHPHHDRGLDPYWRERDYDPMKQGTYWGKWRARNPFFQTRALRIIQGTLGQTLDEMTTRHYVIDTFKGPSADGSVSITAKDVLKLADDDKAQAPRASAGSLTVDADAKQTRIYLKPKGVGMTYPGSGLVNIGNEIMSFTRDGDEMTVVRGERGTTADSHSQDDAVQLVLEYEGIVSEILDDLLRNYTEIDPQFLDLDRWRAEDDMYISRVFYTVIAEPTAVKDLIGELCEQVGLQVWWDEIEQKVRMRAVRQPDQTPALLTDDADWLTGSLAVSEQQASRISQVWVYYGVLDPTEKQDEARNYGSRYVGIDTDAESGSEYATPQIHKVYARWISRFNRPAAEQIVQRLLSRYTRPPRAIAGTLAWNNDKCRLGYTNDLRTRLIQDDIGQADTRRIIVKSLEQGLESIKIEAEEFTYDPGPADKTKRLVIDNNSGAVNLRQAFDRIYPSVSPGDTVFLDITDGAILGSGSTVTPALTIGDWPNNVTIRIRLDGRIQGRGGAGGQGGGTDSGRSGRSGGNGGPALYTRYPIIIEGTGDLWSGAGGGGGGGLGDSVGDQDAAGGGGGGCGYIGGDGGLGGNSADQSNGETGAPGTTDAGGAGGQGVQGAGPGGRGGSPGGNGLDGPSNGGGSGGRPGVSINGTSFITYAEGSNINIQGPQVAS